MSTELIVIAPPEIMDAQLVVVSTTLAEYLDTAAMRGMEMTVNSPESLNKAAENMNDLAKGIGAVEARVKELRKPYNDHMATISETGRKAVIMAQRARDEQARKIKLYQDEVEAQRQRVLAQQRAAQAEAERQQREAEALAKRNAEEARIKAEAAQREAERLKWEAEEKERRAAVDLSGPRTNQAFDDGAAKLAEAAQADAAAAQAQLQADEAQRLAVEAAAVEAPLILAAPVEVMPQEAKAKGIKTKLVPEILSTDVTKLPAAYLLPNETLIKKHLTDGIKVPGVTFKMHEVVVATKR